MKRAAKKKYWSGQSAAELAIFGSIVIFVIGLVFKVALSVNQSADISLRAFRKALHESYLTATGHYSGDFSGARNSSSILLMEDRLTVNPSEKMGTRDRAPLMAQGSGTMSHTLFMEVDPNDEYDASIFDAFINGQRFPFSITAVKTQDFTTLPLCVGWGYGPNTGACRNSDGSVRLFKRVYNGDEGEEEDEDDDWDPLDDTRFDLDFNGTIDVDAAAFISPGATDYPLRNVFAWQWVPVNYTNMDDAPEEGDELDVDGDWKTETIISCSYPVGCGIWDPCDYPAPCTVTDRQDGDIDMTVDEATEKRWAIDHPSLTFRKPGLGRDMRMYSFTSDGTMLRIEEGKLYAANGQYVRNETRQDHIDIIERVFYLSNNTGRFCDGENPRKWEDSVWARNNGVYGMVNPVEACGNCFSNEGGDDRRKLTCMDLEIPVIFVRSRIRDKRQQRWITRTEDRD